MKFLLVLAFLVVCYLIYHYTAKIYFDKGKEYVYRHTSNQIETLQKKIQYLEHTLTDKDGAINTVKTKLDDITKEIASKEQSIENIKKTTDEYKVLVDKLSENDDLHRTYIGYIWALFVVKAAPFRRNITYVKQEYQGAYKLLVTIDKVRLAIPITRGLYNMLNCEYQPATDNNYTHPKVIIRFLKELI